MKVLCSFEWIMLQQWWKKCNSIENANEFCILCEGQRVGMGPQIYRDNDVHEKFFTENAEKIAEDTTKYEEKLIKEHKRNIEWETEGYEWSADGG